MADSVVNKPCSKANTSLSQSPIQIGNKKCIYLSSEESNEVEHDSESQALLQQNKITDFDDDRFEDDLSNCSTSSTTTVSSSVSASPLHFANTRRKNPFNLNPNIDLFSDETPNGDKFTRVHCYLLIKLYLIMSALMFGVLLLLLTIVASSKPQLNNVDNEANQTTTVSSISTTLQLGLDTNNQFRLFWTIDEADESLLFELRIKQDKTFDLLDWFAFGFSNDDKIINADLCLLWFDKRGKVHFSDITTDNESFALIDAQSNDCQLLKIKRQKRVLRFAFRRAFDTCDPEDYVIDSGTTHLVYATGSGPVSRVEGLRLRDHRNGFQRTQLLKPRSAWFLSKLSPNVHSVDFVVTGNQSVPSQETTYWCRLIRLPDDFKRKTHVVQYEAIIAAGSESLVHHMELFHCEVSPQQQLPPWDGQCTDPALPEPLKACKRVVAAWAYGAGPMTYPNHVGLPVGGANYSLYVMLEIHYNNPQHQSRNDKSGIRLYYTNHLRPVDAGILEIGIEYTDKNSIPPGVVMELRGYCVAECTQAALPPYGITIFASQLHTHLTGVKTWTQHVRGGVSLWPEINRDNHYSPHFQEIRKLPKPITVFPGDALIHVCRYNTRSRKNITLGGFGITDEMCVNYMHYYPKTNLEVCKSSVDTHHLKQYFDQMHNEEAQNTSATRYSVAENFHNIEWNLKRARELDHLYKTAPLSMQCNQSSGERFPGYWNGIPLTNVVKQLNPLHESSNSRCRWQLQKAKTINREEFIQDGNFFNEKIDTNNDFSLNNDDDDEDEDSQKSNLFAMSSNNPLLTMERQVNDESNRVDNDILQVRVQRTSNTKFESQYNKHAAHIDNEEKNGQ